MRIPTIFGLTLLITAALLSTMYYSYHQDLTSQTQTDLSPQDIRFTNIASDTFTITWTSLQSVTGSLSWGETNQLGFLQNDSRDTSAPISRFTHSVTLNNLKEKTAYFFKIRSGAFFYPNQPLSLTTPSQLNPGVQSPVIGTTLDANQQPLTDALIFLETTGASVLSGPIGTNGSFVIPLSNLRTSDLSKNFDLTTSKSASLLLQTGTKQTHTNLTIPTQKPLPPIILNQNSNLTK